MFNRIYYGFRTAAIFVCLTLPNAAYAQIGPAIERAAARAALKAAQSQAVKRATAGLATSTPRSSINHATDRVVRKWSSSLCKPAAPCPLDEKTANTFRGGSYKEVILGRDTTLYRAYHNPGRKFGDPSGQVSYWSRSDATGTKAVVDRGIEVSRYGNTADRLVAIKVPKGTRVYEGIVHGIHKGPIGGGNQIILNKVKPEWEIIKP